LAKPPASANCIVVDYGGGTGARSTTVSANDPRIAAELRGHDNPMGTDGFESVEYAAPDAGRDMAFDLPRLIAHAARTRALGAGTITGSGTVCNRDRAAGCSCIAEKRTIETLESAAPRTSFLRFGDRVRIEMPDRDGATIFGAIEQEPVRYAGA